MDSRSSIIRTTKRLALAGLAAAVAVFAMPDIAQAQRAVTGDVWGLTLEHGDTRVRSPRQECSPIQVSHRSGRSCSPGASPIPNGASCCAALGWWTWTRCRQTLSRRG